MSNVAPINSGQELAVVEAPAISSNAMILNEGNFSRAVKFAEMMATAAVAVPQHLRGKTGDCMAIVMQSAQWKMNPFAVAQKTHFVNGSIGYEAQLVNAVVQESGAIVGRFHYEYSGDGVNLACRVGAVIRGEREITWGEWLRLADVAVKNSPLWKTNPKQQLGYLQVKNWARLYTPGAILGVYTPDELETPPAERDMGPAEVVSTRTPGPLPDYPQDQFEKNLPAWLAAIKEGRITAEQIVVRASTKYIVTGAQRDQIYGAVSQEPEPQPEVAEGAAAPGDDNSEWLKGFDGEAQ